MSSGEAMWSLRNSELTEQECPLGRRGLKKENKSGRSPRDFGQGGGGWLTDEDEGKALSTRAPCTPPERASGAKEIGIVASLCDDVLRPRDAAPMRSPRRGGEVLMKVRGMAWAGRSREFIFLDVDTGRSPGIFWQKGWDCDVFWVCVLTFFLFLQGICEIWGCLLIEDLSGCGMVLAGDTSWRRP